MKRALVLLGLGFIAGFGILFALGSMRYGGPNGLLMRVRAEISHQRPQNAFVPTPLPTATGPSPTAVAAATAAPSMPAPTDPPSSPAAPTAAPTVAPTLEPTAAPAPSYAPAAPSVQLTGLRHAWQTWNNCGPATLAMYLSYYGSALDQEDIRLVVRPNPEDKHAGAEEMAEVARSEGLHALVRANGTPEMLRLLISNGVPVMVSTWHEDDPGDGMGHYRLLVGYDDATQEWIMYDSLAATVGDRNAPYSGVRMSYTQLAEWWRVFNNTYTVIYNDDTAEAVRAILGEDMDDRAMWERALAAARATVEQQPEDPFAWFNLGTNLVALEQHEEAAGAYDRARQLGLPWRMLWYQFSPFAAYYHVGRYDEVVALADATLRVTTHLEELHYWRGMALVALGNPSAGAEAFRTALQLKPGFPPAAEALGALGG